MRPCQVYHLAGLFVYTKTMTLIVSLFDYTGIWSQPYRDAGYDVLQIDIQHGRDILTEPIVTGAHGIILQPPCTDFAGSGARWFADKDADGRTEESVKLVKTGLAWVKANKPAWWVLENPIGRIHKMVPELGQPIYKFSPHQYGETYRKTTWLWGNFNPPLPTTPENRPQGTNPAKTITFQGQTIHVRSRPDNWYNRVGGNSIETKNIRSKTSKLFAAEFFKANP